MNYKGHLITGLISTFIYVSVLYYLRANFEFFDYLVIPFIWFLYSQLPDIDSQSSKIRFLLTVVAVLTAIYFILIEDSVMAIVALVCLLFIWVMKYIKSFGHRGVLHRHYAGALLASPLLIFSIWAYGLGVLNYSTHVIVDWVWSKYAKREE